MKKRLKILTALILSVGLLINGAITHKLMADEASRQRIPLIGYCQGEDYYEFDYSLQSLLAGMEEYGIISELSQPIPVDGTADALWNWLSRQDQSRWPVRFEKESFYTLGEGELEGLSDGETAEYLSSALRSRGVDLVITMGTVAGLTIKSLDSPPAQMNFCAADPVKSGIVLDPEKSGVPGVWAQTDRDAFLRTLTVMADIFKPETVGVVYADSEEAYIYSGADVLDEAAEELGYRVVRAFVEDPPTSSREDMEAYYQALSEAFNKLSEEADVFIHTTSLIEMEDLPALFRPFYEKHIPVYSINSVEDVKYGALMATQSMDYKNIGRFGADMLARYLEGERLEDLPQIYSTAPFLVLNYDVAQKVGYRPSFKLLLSASKIYTEGVSITH